MRAGEVHVTVTFYWVFRNPKDDSNPPLAASSARSRVCVQWYLQIHSL
jgi:hypothetical protein